MKIAKIALDVPLPTLFDYCAEMEVQIGDRVVIPFGTRRVVGVVLELATKSELPDKRLRGIERVMTDAPALPAEWLELVRFCAAYYHRPLGETVLQALPPRLKALKNLPREDLRSFCASALAPEPATLRSGRKRVLLAELKAADALDERALLGIDPAERGPRRAALRALINAGWAEPAPPRSGARFVSEHVLTAEQEAALARILPSVGKYATHLLHGVTGSGKTEIYLRLAARVLQSGGQALVLVPEISLTPQLEARFRRAFPDNVLSVLHSGLEDSARTAAWLRAARGEAGVILGTRLAVLAPVPRLGLIVVDEEHDTSFKQQDGLRYSARDVAVFRGNQRKVPVVLGSATPALESYANALALRYQLIELPSRAVSGARMPQVKMVDLRAERADQGFARPLLDAIAARLARGEQSLLFINRRGYAPVLACPACGYACGCTRCSAHLVLHAVDRRLRCHHCGREEAIPRHCPQCGNADLRALGRGTQRVEETLEASFPGRRVIRIDRDSARRRAQLARTLEQVRSGEGDILVGTQLVAKGHDFPRLTLVGVLNADNSLLATDYRAAERLFSVLLQVSGRAGRHDRPGEVLVQTRFPDHPLFAALARNDYPGFARSQLQEREAAGFPPFVYEAALRAECPRLADALAFLRGAVTRAPGIEGVRVFDPAPNALSRRAGLERAQLLVQSTSRRALQEFLRRWVAELYASAPKSVQWHLDVDPTDSD
ncbi:MAG: primosomal protein N' [Betaproteobacteria bacterium]|nr:primosomal protein N' [Betaproteobacteria bacterium]